MALRNQIICSFAPFEFQLTKWNSGTAHGTGCRWHQGDRWNEKRKRCTHSLQICSVCLHSKPKWNSIELANGICKKHSSCRHSHCQVQPSLAINTLQMLHSNGISFLSWTSIKFCFYKAIEFEYFNHLCVYYTIVEISDIWIFIL